MAAEGAGEASAAGEASPGGPGLGGPGPGETGARELHARSFKLRFASQREQGRSYVSLVKPLGLRKLWRRPTASRPSSVSCRVCCSRHGDGQVLRARAGGRGRRRHAARAAADRGHVRPRPARQVRRAAHQLASGRLVGGRPRAGAAPRPAPGAPRARLGVAEGASVRARRGRQAQATIVLYELFPLPCQS